MKPSLIIFDCDGTLADTEIRHQETTVAVLKACGFDGYDVGFCGEHFAGRGMTYVVDFLEKREGRKLPPDFMERYIQTYLSLIQKGAVPVPGAPEAVRAFSEDYKMCVASNGEPDNVMSTVRSLGLLEMFGEDCIFTKSQVARGKPAPDLFLFAARMMGVSPENCIVIEDSLPGVQAGLAAGMRTIGLTAASHDPVALRAMMTEIGVREVCKTWADVVTAIKT